MFCLSIAISLVLRSLKRQIRTLRTSPNVLSLLLKGCNATRLRYCIVVKLILSKILPPVKLECEYFVLSLQNLIEVDSYDIGMQ